MNDAERKSDGGRQALKTASRGPLFIGRNSYSSMKHLQPSKLLGGMTSVLSRLGYRMEVSSMYTRRLAGHRMGRLPIGRYIQHSMGGYRRSVAARLTALIT